MSDVLIAACVRFLVRLARCNWRHRGDLRLRDLCHAILLTGTQVQAQCHQFVCRRAVSGLREGCPAHGQTRTQCHSAV
jgi:hypothetical protein